MERGVNWAHRRPQVISWITVKTINVKYACFTVTFLPTREDYVFQALSPATINFHFNAWTSVLHTESNLSLHKTSQFVINSGLQYWSYP